MSELIDRQAAIEAFGLSEKTRKYGGDHSGYDTRMLYEIKDVLEGLPTIESEIIHCAECIYYGRADKRRFYRGYDCLQGRIASIVPDRDFCSRARRRRVKVETN